MRKGFWSNQEVSFLFVKKAVNSLTAVEAPVKRRGESFMFCKTLPQWRFSNQGTVQTQPTVSPPSFRIRARLPCHLCTAGQEQTHPRAHSQNCLFSAACHWFTWAQRLFQAQVTFARMVFQQEGWEEFSRDLLGSAGMSVCSYRIDRNSNLGVRAWGITIWCLATQNNCNKCVILLITRPCKELFWKSTWRKRKLY